MNRIRLDNVANNLVLDSLIGKGSRGELYTGHDLDNNLITVKIVNIDKLLLFCIIQHNKFGAGVLNYGVIPLWLLYNRCVEFAVSKMFCRCSSPKYTSCSIKYNMQHRCDAAGVKAAFKLFTNILAAITTPQLKNTYPKIILPHTRKKGNYKS